MLILLIGPKGSGKTHLGRLLATRLGVTFVEVESLWLRYHDACRAAGETPTLAGGIARVHPEIRAALHVHERVAVETTGTSPEVLGDLLSLAPRTETRIVRLTAPLDLCLERIAARDPSAHIPTDDATIRLVHDLSTALDLDADVTIDTASARDDEIVARVAAALRR